MARSPSRTQLTIAIPVVATAGAAVMLGQVMYTAHRDLPAYPNQDLSARFGDPGMPLLRVAALGDSSLTAPGIVDLDNTWPRTCLRGLTDRFEIDLTSVAIGGARASDVRRDQLPQALALRPELAVLSVGGNDALRTRSLPDFTRDMHEIVAALHRAAGAVVIQGVGDVSTSPRIPRTFKRYARNRARLVDAIITDVALAYPRVVRIPSWGRVCDEFCTGERRYWADDLFHASDAGHQLFVEEAAPVFEEAIGILAARRRSAPRDDMPSRRSGG